MDGEVALLFIPTIQSTLNKDKVELTEITLTRTEVSGGTIYTQPIIKRRILRPNSERDRHEVYISQGSAFRSNRIWFDS